MQQLPGIPTLLVIVNSWKRCVGLLVLLNKITDQQHRPLLSFLNLADKPPLIIGKAVAYHSCTRVFTVWLTLNPNPNLTLNPNLSLNPKLPGRVQVN